GAEWLRDWLMLVPFAAVIGFGMMWVKGRRAGVDFTAPAARRFFASYFAPIVAAAVLTYVFWRGGFYAAMPPMWLLLYGTSFVSAGAYSINLIRVMGVLFMLFGAAAAIV